MLIAFVCTGNTCRSPIAEAAFNALAAEPHHAMSCGIAVSVSAPASPGALYAAKKYNLDLSMHRSQPVSRKMLEESDKVLCMTESHSALLRSLYPEFAPKISTLLDCDVPDPYGGGEEDYAEAVRLIYDGVCELVRALSS